MADKLILKIEIEEEEDGGYEIEIKGQHAAAFVKRLENLLLPDGACCDGSCHSSGSPDREEER